MIHMSLIRRILHLRVGLLIRSSPAYSSKSDCHLDEAIKELKKRSNTPSKIENSKLLSKDKSGSLQPTDGARKSRAPSIRQLRLSNQISDVVSKELIKTGKGSVIDIYEVSLSRDLRNVTVHWLLEDANHNDKKIKILIKNISAWLEKMNSKLRFQITNQISFKYSPSLIFRYDKARANAMLLDKMLEEQQRNLSDFEIDDYDLDEDELEAKYWKK
mmetsp:Transcript_13300/g.17239  ORF Transcript_13300/g.17239 Transcript_13300/m.17239 type:complete len:216 (+) Transcript_13300:65-712(+)